MYGSAIGHGRDVTELGQLVSSHDWSDTYYSSLVFYEMPRSIKLIDTHKGAWINTGNLFRFTLHFEEFI